MAATAGSLIAIGKSGRTYSVDLYVPDAVATSITFNPAGLAGSGSPTSWRVPEDLVITDVALAGAPTAVGATFLVNGAVANGGTIRHANQASTNANRALLRIPVRAGDFVAATQF